MVLTGTSGIMQPEGKQVSIRHQTGGAAKLVETRDTVPSVVTARDVGPDQDLGTLREYQAFANSIRSGEKPLVSGQVGKEAIKIALLAEKSLRERRIVSWNDLPA
jgi:predicted dehydrogenase